MTDAPASVQRARDLLADAERGERAAAAVRDIYDGISAVAETVSNTTVALLSLLPFVPRDQQALDFYSDAMGSQSEAMRLLLDTQGAAKVLVATITDQLDALERRHSVKV